MSEGFGSLRGSTEWSLQEGTEKIKKKKKKKRRGGTTLTSNVIQLSQLSTRIRGLSPDKTVIKVIGIHILASPKAIVSQCPHYGIQEPKVLLQSAKLRVTKNPKPTPDISHNGCS